MEKKELSAQTASLLEQLKATLPEDWCTQSCWDTYNTEVGLCWPDDGECKLKANRRLHACIAECGKVLEGEQKQKVDELLEQIAASR